MHYIQQNIGCVQSEVEIICRLIDDILTSAFANSGLVLMFHQICIADQAKQIP